MKKTLATLSILAVLSVAGAAPADEVTGTVMAIDPASRMIQLDDGVIYSVSDGVVLDDLQPGLMVTVSYEDGEGAPVITDVTPAQ